MARHYTHAELGQRYLDYGHSAGKLDDVIQRLGDQDSMKWLAALTAKNSDTQTRFLIQIQDWLRELVRETKKKRPSEDRTNPMADAMVEWARGYRDPGSERLASFAGFRNLTVRARKAILRLGMVTVDDLVKATDDELLSTKNVGVTTLCELRGFQQAIQSRGQTGDLP